MVLFSSKASDKTRLTVGFTDIEYQNEINRIDGGNKFVTRYSYDPNAKTWAGMPSSCSRSYLNI